MNQESRRISPENLWLAAAFVLALLVRLFKLGDIPLSDAEARWAMQAFDLSRGIPSVNLGSQAGYVMFTTLIFYVFQASNVAARLLPAVAGSLVALTPAFFRDRLGARLAIVLSFVLALDPGLLAISRQVGTPTLAMASVFLAWACWRNGRNAWTGFFVGLALLSGPALWPGLVGLALAYGLFRGIFSDEKGLSFDRPRLLSVAGYALGTYLVAGSLFLRQPAGLGAGLASLPDYLRGWVATPDTPALRMMLTLALYQPLPIVLAVIQLVRGIRSRHSLTIFSGLWLVTSLVLALAYPARQVADLGWALLPLWILASLQLVEQLEPIQDGIWETVGMFTLTVAILTFSWFNFSAIALVPMDANMLQLRIYVLAGSIGLLILSIVLVALGWSVQTARQGAAWGAILFAIVYTLGASAAAAQIRAYRTTELWSVSPSTAQADIVTSQLHEFSLWKAGANQSLDIVIADLDSPALRWLLRDWEVSVTSSASLDASPAIVFTAGQQASPVLQSAYRGQDVLWRTYPGWEQASGADWLRWIITHDMPSGRENLILWARTDIFPDYQNQIRP